MKRAVVTGPTGAVGRALLDRLLSEGVEVLAICRPGSLRSADIPKHPLLTKAAAGSLQNHICRTIALLG